MRRLLRFCRLLTCSASKDVLNYFKSTCWQRNNEKDLNDAKEAELCAIAEDCFNDIKDKSMKEVAKAQYQVKVVMLTLTSKQEVKKEKENLR